VKVIDDRLGLVFLEGCLGCFAIVFLFRVIFCSYLSLLGSLDNLSFI